MNKEELTTMPLIDLVNRLNKINKDLQDLQIEYNLIIEELWERIPPLTTDQNMQKRKIKTEEELLFRRR